MEQVPLAPLRWEHISVSIDGLEDVEDVPDRLLAEAEKFVRRLGEAGSAPRALGLRVRLGGASDHYDEIRRRISGGEWNGLGRVVDGTAVFINKVIDAMELPLDLTEIAAGDDPAALMAQRILLLRRDDGQSMALLEEVRAQLRDIARDDQWSPLREHREAIDPLSNESLRNILLGAGTAALHAMLSQNADREPS